MHKYLRAAGFSDITTHGEEEELLGFAGDERFRTESYRLENGEILEGYILDISPSFGISLAGVRDSEGKFYREYYFPFLKGNAETSTVCGSVERHAMNESYAGVLEDFQSGITLIFYAVNSLSIANLFMSKAEFDIKGAYLSALSLEGSILLPSQVIDENEPDDEHRKLYEAACMGDAEAIELITEKEMKVMDEVHTRIMTEDLYSLVQTSFMPFGVECDIYMILGEIISFVRETNKFTGERLYNMKIRCNGCIFQLGINEKDLNGVPEEGRRFKGKIWMMGFVNTDVK